MGRGTTGRWGRFLAGGPQAKMSDKQKVCMWVGEASSKEALDRCLQPDYTEDGDFLPSRFESALKITHADMGRREVSLLAEAQKDVSVLLEGNSYSDQIIPQFVRMNGATLNDSVNAVVLFYECDQKPAFDFYRTDDVFLRFFGAAEYTE
jgi:hypothetical protein